MKTPEKHPLEWLVFAVSLVLVLGTLGYLVYDAARGGEEPPDLVVELGAARRGSQGFRVPVTVRNRGDETAENAHIEVVLTSPGRPPETAGLDIAFVPRGSTRRGWVTFSADPTGRLTGRVLGYEKP